MLQQNFESLHYKSIFVIVFFVNEILLVADKLIRMIKQTFLSDVIYNNLSKGVYVLNAKMSMWFV